MASNPLALTAVSRRGALRLSLASAAMLALPVRARLAAYPERPIRLLVGGPAGGSEDAVARAIGSNCEPILGQPFIIESRSGAGGTPAYLALKRARPDGYTLGLLSLSTVRQPIMQDVGFDAVKDFTYVSCMTDVIFCVVVAASSPFKSFNDLIDFAKHKPKEVSFGAPAGTGNSAHLFGAEMAAREGVTWTVVPYRGSSDTMVALLGGQLTFSIDTLLSAAPMHNTRKARILAFATDVAPAGWDGVPTMKDLGYNLSIDTFYGIGAPADLDSRVLSRLDGALKATCASPGFNELLARNSQRPRYMNHSSFTAFVTNAEARQRDMLTRYGLARP